MTKEFNNIIAVAVVRMLFDIFFECHKIFGKGAASPLGGAEELPPPCLFNTYTIACTASYMLE